jgi:hypothetical protein
MFKKVPDAFPVNPLFQFYLYTNTSIGSDTGTLFDPYSIVQIIA